MRRDDENRINAVEEMRNESLPEFFFGQGFLSVPGSDLFCCSPFPDSYGAVATAGDDLLTVAGEGDGEDGTVVPSEAENFTARGGFPKTRGLIITASQDACAVRRKRACGDYITVAF